MLVRTPGIVIKSTKYSESSVIVKIYTQALGIQTYIINGVRSPKAAIKPSLLQPLTLLELVVYNRPNQNIHRVKEAKASPVLNSLPFNVMKSSIGMYISELVYRAVREEEPDENLYAFLEQFILAVDGTGESDNMSLYPLYLTLHLSRYLGFFPNDNFSEQNAYFLLEEGAFSAYPGPQELTLEPPFSASLAALMQLPLNEVVKFSMARSVRMRLMHVLMDYYRLHIGNFQPLKSLKVLESVLH